MVESNIHNTLGAMFIGLIPSTILYGVTCLQTWNYYMAYPKDSIWMKGVVGGVFITDTANLCFICAAMYLYLITNFANPAYAATLNMPIAVEVLFNGFTALLVQLFFAWRIWLLAGKRKVIYTAVVLFLITIQWAANIGFVIVTVQIHLFANSSKPWTGALDATAVLTDVVISVFLCIILSSSKTDYAATNNMIDRLILFALNTGLITSACAIAALIAYYALPNTTVYVGIYLLLGRLYANSLLATLNARSFIRSGSNNPGSYSLDEPRHTRMRQGAPTANDMGGISVQIETMRDLGNTSRNSVDSGRKAPDLQV